MSSLEPTVPAFALGLSLCRRHPPEVVQSLYHDRMIVQECESDAWFERPDGISDEQMAEIIEPMKERTESYARRSTENMRKLLEILPPSEPIRTVLSD